MNSTEQIKVLPILKTIYIHNITKSPRYLITYQFSYIKDVYTIGEIIPYFPILRFVQILKFFVVHKMTKIRKDF